MRERVRERVRERARERERKRESSTPVKYDSVLSQNIKVRYFFVAKS